MFDMHFHFSVRIIVLQCRMYVTQVPYKKKKKKYEIRNTILFRNICGACIQNKAIPISRKTFGINLNLKSTYVQFELTSRAKYKTVFVCRSVYSIRKVSSTCAMRRKTRIINLIVYEYIYILYLDLLMCIEYEYIVLKKMQSNQQKP